jgi:hypothetical protein
MTAPVGGEFTTSIGDVYPFSISAMTTWLAAM